MTVMDSTVSFFPPGRWSHPAPARPSLVTPPSPAHSPGSAPRRAGFLGAPGAVKAHSPHSLCSPHGAHPVVPIASRARSSLARSKNAGKTSFLGGKKTPKVVPSGLAPLICMAPHDVTETNLHTQTRALAAIYGWQRANVSGGERSPRPAVTQRSPRVTRCALLHARPRPLALAALPPSPRGHAAPPRTARGVTPAGG